jgi:hypothetical protein
MDEFTQTPQIPRVDSLYHIRTNASVRRGSIWGINMDLYYIWRGGAFCLRLEDSYGQGKKSTLSCMWATNLKNQHVVTDEMVEFEN